jgi:hypothetical protein
MIFLKTIPIFGFLINLKKVEITYEKNYSVTDVGIVRIGHASSN